MLYVPWTQIIFPRRHKIPYESSELFTALIIITSVMIIIFNDYCKLNPQSRYKRGCRRPISNMDFQFLAIWAAQGITEKKNLG